MPKFDASSVGAIEYDFTSWNVPDQGTVPEPSRQQVNGTMKRVTAAFKEMGMGDVEESPEGIASAMDKIDDDNTFEEMTVKLIDAVADLCSGKPSRDSLDALPYRVFMGFFGYIIGEVMSPEGSAPATNNSPKTRLRSA